VYYVDLKPTVADVRIFTPDADHPNGWGTILIGGFRMGGSCGSCASGTGAPPMTVTISGTPRTFYSAYFVLDITNPDVDPKLLWSFSNAGLGLTTGTPTVMRVSPTADSKIDNTNAKWMVLFGSGPNGYAADLPAAPAQSAKLYAVDLKVGPGAGNSQVTTMPVGSLRSFLGNITALDRDNDYRDDVAYFGRTMHDGSLPWRGKFYRLTTSGCTNAPCSTSTWGVPNGGNRSATEMIDTFYDYNSGGGTTVEMGPVTTAPSLTIDDANKVWVFFGTGRYLSNSDKTSNEQQYLFGIKDNVMNSGCTQTNTTNCLIDDTATAQSLVNTTNAVVCIVCAPGTNQMTDPNNPTVTDVTKGPTSMAGLVQSKDGWYVKLVTAAGTSAERSVSSPVVIAGAVFFPTLVPTNDFCSSTGTSYLYALYYKTGSAYSSPIIGTSASGANTNSNTRIQMGEGVASQVAIHVQGTGGVGGGGGGGTACSQMSTGSAQCTKFQGPNPLWSRYVTWERQRA
ncbi:MAG: PilC/PilY family type IV pilus protein, partial [Nitrospiraceae bacterium]